MTLKDELLRNLDDKYKHFLDTVDGLDEAHLSEVWLGEWSIREIAAHLSGWHREIGAGLSMARGERPFPEGTSFGDVHNWNEKFASTAQGIMASDVLRELKSPMPTLCTRHHLFPMPGTSRARQHTGLSTEQGAIITGNMPNRSARGDPHRDFRAHAQSSLK